MKASRFVNEITEYMKHAVKEYGMTNEMCYPYHDQYGFIEVKGLKTHRSFLFQKNVKV